MESITELSQEKVVDPAASTMGKKSWQSRTAGMSPEEANKSMSALAKNGWKKRKAAMRKKRLRPNARKAKMKKTKK